jgi:hypothetical protein
MLTTIEHKMATKAQVDRLVSGLQAIAKMKINGETNHAELTALMQTVATLTLRDWCCGDAACFNESDRGVCR